jgi:precorrin-2/cobalt-factor-2 C20-methyltransferase
VPLAVLREKVAVIPLLASAAALEGYLREFETVVLIKVRGALDYVRPAVAAGYAMTYYAERLGTPAQYLTTDLADLAGRELPYFSLLILKSLLCN